MKTILITGCSSGLGRSAARQLLERGVRVIATARKKEALADLAGHENCIAASLDVTSATSRNALVKKLNKDGIVVDVLVNNAGYGYYGPLEEVSAADLRSQFETNVFGLLELTQLFLPQMRERKSGRIVMVSSLVGLVSFPYLGLYCASKFALEAMISALRGELKSWGIEVTSVNPGPVKTNFAEVSRGRGLEILKPGSAYTPMFKNVLGRSSEDGRHADKKMTSDEAAAVIVQACLAGRVRRRYMVTSFARMMKLLEWLLPAAVFERVLWKAMKV